MIELRPHQEDALSRLRSGSVLNGGVGSGKSIVALEFWKRNYSHLPLVVITTAQKRDVGEWLKDADLVEIAIPILIDSWNNIYKYTNISGSFFIFDEDRVTGGGLWAKSFIRLAKQNEWVMLSATPGDCWLDYLPLFLAHGWYKNKTEFMQKHVRLCPWVKYPKVDHYENVEVLFDLRNAILCDMDFPRHTKQHHIYVPVPYDEPVYSEAIKTRFDPFKNRPCQDISAVCTLLRKIVYSDIRRLDALTEILNKHPKLIVFYNYDFELDRLRGYAITAGIIEAEWNGHRHQPIPDSESWLYLVQYNAGKEGWNCTDTDAMVFYSSSYSNKTMVQAAGRIDRLTTAYSDLYYYHLTAGSTIENAIETALKEKRIFNERRWLNGFDMGENPFLSDV